jgi:hypothetical protein
MGKRALMVVVMMAAGLAGSEIIFSDSFVVSADGEAANGVYKYSTTSSDTGGLLKGANTAVVTTGSDGNWGGNGYITAMQSAGSDGYANIKMNQAVSARASRTVNASAGGALYFSMSVSADALLSANQAAYFGMGNSLSSLPAEGSQTQGFMLGIESDGDSMSLIARLRQENGGAYTMSDNVINSVTAGETYNLIVKVTPTISGGIDGFSLWIDPVDSSELNNAAAFSLDASSDNPYYEYLNASSFTSLGLFYEGTDNSNVANVTADNIMLATTWDEVYGNVVPEPATIGLLGLGALGTLLVRRFFLS